MTDVVAELRRLYEALPALLDVVEAARRVANPDSTLSDLYMLRDKLAALEQDGAQCH